MVEGLAQQRRVWRSRLIAGAVLLGFAPLSALGMTLIGMTHSFATATRSTNPSPDELATGADIARLALPPGALLALCGAALIVHALRRRRRLDALELYMGDAT